MSFIITVFMIAGFITSSCGNDKSGENNNSGSEKNYESYSVERLLPNTTYYWKVVADDGKGGVTESDDCSFTTGG